MAEDILISTIVCAYSLKRFDKTVNCIETLLNNNYKNLEIIVVIDGNEELRQKIKSKFRNLGKVLIIGNNIDEGPSIARNRGIEHSRGDIIAFIDDDAYVSVDWLERIAKTFHDYSDIISVGGKLLPVYENGVSKLPEEILWIVGCTYKGHPENKQFVRNVISANMAVRKDIFKDIKFETIHSKNNNREILAPIKELEDTLFCVRLNNRKNNAVLYDPDLIVYHNVPANRLTLSYIIKRTFSEGMLKAKLGNLKTGNNSKVLSYEQNYLNILLISIIKKFYTLRIRDGILLLLTIFLVMSGYIYEYISSRYIDERASKIRQTING